MVPIAYCLPAISLRWFLGNWKHKGAQTWAELEGGRDGRAINIFFQVGKWSKYCRHLIWAEKKATLDKSEPDRYQQFLSSPPENIDA